MLKMVDKFAITHYNRIKSFALSKLREIQLSNKEKEKMKRFVKIVLVVALIAGLPMGIKFGLQQHDKTVVEAYCAEVYQHNVSEYKACTVQKPLELIEGLTSKAKEQYDTISLPELK